MEILTKNFCNTLKNLVSLPSVRDLSAFLEGETAFLFIIKDFGDKPATPSQLSEELGVTKGRITAIINSLTRKDMVRLEKVDGDRRKVDVRITEKGKNYIDEKLASTNAFLRSFIDKIGRKDAEELMRILNRTVEVMRDENIEGLDATDQQKKLIDNFQKHMHCKD